MIASVRGSVASIAVALLSISAAGGQSEPPSILQEPLAPRSPFRAMTESETPGPSNALPGGNPMGGTGPMGGGAGSGGPPGCDAIWYPSRSISGQNADLGLVRQGVNVGAPLWQDGGDRLMASVGVRHTLFSRSAILPDTGRAFPDQLWNVSFGLNAMHRFDNGWMGMLMVGFGSASDKPFHSIREVTANLGGFVRFPAANDRDSWTLGAMYMAGGPVNFPLPMVSYGWNPSERLQVNIGLPLSVNWKPTDEWILALSYMPLLTINARATYAFDPALRVYAGYEYLNESYFLAGRADSRDRFFGFEQRLVTGLQWDAAQWATVELNGGYSFGRYYGEGNNQFGSLRDKVDVAPGPFLGATFRMKF